jgi:hypothetical protein
MQPDYYEHLPTDVAKLELTMQKSNFLRIHTFYANEIPSLAERTYFDRALAPNNLA